MQATIELPEGYQARIVRDELREHLIRSGDTHAEETIKRCEEVLGKEIHCAGGTVTADFDGFFWVRTRTLRVAI